MFTFPFITCASTNLRSPRCRCRMTRHAPASPAQHHHVCIANTFASLTSDWYVGCVPLASQDTPSDLYWQVGQRIREARTKLRMSQEALADQVSLTRTSITNIEKGRQKLLVHKLWEIAVALGVSTTDLLPEMKAKRSPINRGKR